MSSGPTAQTTSLEKHDEHDELGSSGASDIDLATYHEHSGGRLVCDPEEARIEFGEDVASRLKLSKDGKYVLWPQPSDDPNDPQNWSNRRKALQLLIITLTASVAEFQAGTGIPTLFPIAKQFHTSTGAVNDVASSWNIFLLGWGSIFIMMFARRYGRLPVLFWSQILGLGFFTGCTFAPNLVTFSAMRCLTSFFVSPLPVTGLYVITDIFPFHLQARKVNIWTMGFILSPFLSPFLFGFLVAHANWRWAFGIGCIYATFVLLLTALFARETMYDRAIRPAPRTNSTGLRLHVETLVGKTGIELAKYRPPLTLLFFQPLKIVWRPHVLPVLIFEAMVLGFGIGMNVTNVVFLGHTPVIGFNFSASQIAATYASPIIGVIIGQIVGRYLNDWIMTLAIKRNKGVFEAENRLWACYISVPLFVCGSVLLGAAFQKHMSIGAVVMGWGIAEVAIMINTVAVYAYLNDCFPKNPGEISILVNLARTLGAFAVPFFQVPWATKRGALQTFGVEAAIVVGLFVLVVPVLQLRGTSLRKRFSMK